MFYILSTKLEYKIGSFEKYLVSSEESQGNAYQNEAAFLFCLFDVSHSCQWHK